MRLAAILLFVFGQASLAEVPQSLEADQKPQEQLLGEWKGRDSTVSLTKDRVSFRMREFKHEGPVKYEKAYAGYFTDFVHRGKKYIFIIGVHWPEDKDRNMAYASVAHDIQPWQREAVLWCGPRTRVSLR